MNIEAKSLKERNIFWCMRTEMRWQARLRITSELTGGSGGPGPASWHVGGLSADLDE